VAEKYGVGLINASPLSMGLLTNQGPPDWHPAPAAIKDACRRVAELCRDRGADVSFLGMQFCLAEPRIPTTLTGTAVRSELEVNLRALPEPIDRDLLADVRAVLAPVKDLTWPSGNWKG
jgi:L-galactose dehydrogenase